MQLSLTDYIEHVLSSHDRHGRPKECSNYDMIVSFGLTDGEAAEFGGYLTRYAGELIAGIEAVRIPITWEAILLHGVRIGIGLTDWSTNDGVIPSDDAA